VSSDGLRQPVFLSTAQVEAIHGEEIKLYGGPAGLRSRDLLESAVDAPRNLYLYGDAESDIFDWAASYCSHLARNHAFLDGNKRTGFASALSFLKINGLRFPARAKLIKGLALSDELLARAIEEHLKGRWTEEAIARTFFFLVAPWILGFTSKQKGDARPSDIKFKSKAEKDAYEADRFLTAMTMKLIKICERSSINPKRLHGYHAAGTDGVARVLRPDFQREFGIIPNEPEQ